MPNTTELARQFKTREGRDPTNEELLGLVGQRNQPLSGGMLEGASPGAYRPLGISTNQPSINKGLSDAVYGSQGEFLGTEQSIERQRNAMGISETPEQKAAREAQELSQGEERIRSEEESRKQLAFGEIKSKFGEATKQAEEQFQGQRQGVIGAGSAQAQGLGFSSAISGYLENLETRHKDRISRLNAAKKKALDLGSLQSFQEIEQRLHQMELAHIDALDRAQQRQNELQEQAFGIQIKEREFERQEQQQLWQDLERSASVGIISPKLKNTLDAQYGIGFTQKALDFFQSQKQAESVEQQIESISKLNILLEAVPEGQPITIGGQTYTGQKVGKFSLRHELDEKTGTLTTIAFDEEGNPVNINQVQAQTPKRIGGAGGIGKITQTDFVFTLEKLNESRGEDGYVNTQIYSDLIDVFRIKGKTSQFYANFPPEEFLNPNDPTAKKFFQTATQAQAREKTTLDQILEKL